MTTPWWPILRHLFEVDDGSLPDIFVEDLSPEQIVTVYEWLRGQCSGAGDSTLWHIDLQQDVLVSDVAHPARAFVQGKVEDFRHGLVGLRVGGVELPPLTVGVGTGGLSMDYRMGPDWNEQTLRALLELLRQVWAMAPHARILRADEGGHACPDLEFTEALRAYVAGGAN
ncbi:MAG: hypothetical protein V4679_16225 [Pseudomonadota bacterium]